MRCFIYYFAVFFFLTASVSKHANASGSTSFATLNIEQKKMWQRILLQEDDYFRPTNADYYLSDTATPDLAKEFDLAEQYLRGSLQFTGQTDAAPWCQFPARFAFVSKVLYGSYFMPEAYRPCNIPLPSVDSTLKADVIQTLEPMDSGEALFHMDLLVQGKRFYNGSVLTLNIGYGRINDKPESNYHNPNAFDKALRLVKAFGGSGEVTIKTDNSPNNFKENRYGQQLYHINLPPEKIYFLVLMAFETKRAVFPYNLLRANCHSYLEHIFLALLPELTTRKRIFFDFMPHFMANTNEAYGQIFTPDGYWPSPSNQLDLTAKQLKWNEYALLQDFLSDGALPSKNELKTSRPLRIAIGKAAEQNESALKNLPELIALRDEYLSSTLHQSPMAYTTHPPAESEDAVPTFKSPHPSVIGLKALHVDGEAKLQFEIDVFNTMADRLQAAAPYGFAMGKAIIQASKRGLAFDHFVLAEENSVGNACCGATLYQLGVRRMSGLSLDIVNRPQRINLPAWELKPQGELNFRQGIGTVSNNGWSAQLMPSLSVLTYDDFIDLNVNASLGWTNGQWAVSASKLVRIVGPDDRRSTPDEMLNAEYQLSQTARLELSYKHYEKLGTIAGVGYAFAF